MKKRIFIISLILLGLANLSFGQTSVSPSKKKLVADLTVNTSGIFPADKIDEVFKEVQAEKMAETAKRITDTIAAKIEANDKLTAQEKAEIKARIPELSQKLSKLAMDFMVKDFTIKKWTNSAFQKYYSSEFTNSELRQLNTYFKTASGKQIAKIFKTLIIGGITDEKEIPNAKNDALMESFMKKPFAEKFFDVLLKNIVAEVMEKTDDWSKKALTEIDKSLENGEMKKLLEDFIAVNVKP